MVGHAVDMAPDGDAVVDPAERLSWRELGRRARLARFKVPERVEVRDALPRNPDGKIVKHLLRSPA